ncbi:MAG TPA: iron-sulfur cluster assembly scaffold protein [Sphingomicrobium sp.]|nr:iron-sulfur cluster assembly scaffold protein [Sphingomicrobium sp.]
MNAPPLYTMEILRLAASLPDPVELERIDGTATERSLTCGSTVSCVVRLGDDNRLEALSQSVQACAFGQACASVVARQASGRGRDEVALALEQLSQWLSGNRAEPPGWPGLEALAPARSRPGRHGAILLPFRALLAAMDSA